MFAEFSEYNVSIDNENRYVLLVKRDVVYLNGTPYRDTDKVKQIVELCERNFEKAVKFLQVKSPSYRGGRQKTLSMQYRGVNVILSCNTPNEQIADFYELLKREIEEILMS